MAVKKRTNYSWRVVFRLSFIVQGASFAKIEAADTIDKDMTQTFFLANCMRLLNPIISNISHHMSRNVFICPFGFINIVSKILLEICSIYIVPLISLLLKKRNKFNEVANYMLQGEFECFSNISFSGFTPCYKYQSA